jgi:glycosyltransferase involved in cell wall biosynthesis
VGDDGPRMAVSGAPSVVYVATDKMGGMIKIVANLVAHRRQDGLAHHVVLTRNRLQNEPRSAEVFQADSETVVEYALPVENLRSVIRRLARAVPSGGGVLVVGDLLDLAAASVHDFGRVVLYMLHGDVDYYYELARVHDATVHGYIAYSRRLYERLLALLPHRSETIFYLPYGIPLSTSARTSAAGALRLLYAGRIENRQKGVFDLPEIDRRLTSDGIRVEWTIAGSGPDEAELRRRWSFNPSVRWAGAVAPASIDSLCASHDILVLPTRFEGFPVVLLEAMSAGAVPMVSDIPSGVPEIVTEATGARPGVGDVRAFAAAIGALDRDRPRLARMSAAAREAVATRFDIRDRVAAYHSLYSRWRELYRPLAAPRHLRYGSRLDRPWLPNTIVKAVRSARRRQS